MILWSFLAPKILASPDTETLRPSGTGSFTQLDRVGDDANWKCVDEAGAHDGLTTYVYSHSGLSSSMDTYATEDRTTGTGTINSVTVHYVISKTGDTPTLAGAALIRTHSTVYWGTFYDATLSWVEHTHTWTDNPFTSSAWTWQEVDDLEIGVELDIGTQEDDDVRCTQVWVVVDYTPGPEVGTYDSDYSTPKDTYSTGETVYAKAISLASGNYDFKYYSGWPDTPLLEGSELDVAESPSGEWRSSYALQGDDPAGTWGVRVYDAGTSTERCSCSFTVQAVSEFAHGAMALLPACFAIFLAKIKRQG